MSLKVCLLQAIPREARNFELGQVKYYVVLVWSAIIWQCFFLGSIGVIFCASSLLSGIIITVLLPATEILAVIFFQEKFQVEKGVALGLSLWGFVSYFYGEMKENKKKKLAAPETLMAPSNNPVGNVWAFVATVLWLPVFLKRIHVHRNESLHFGYHFFKFQAPCILTWTKELAKSTLYMVRKTE